MQEIRHGFTMRKKQGVRYLTIPSFEKQGGVTCAFSTRIGGVSEKPYDTLNFSQKREQDKQKYLENMNRFAAAAGFNYKNAVAINYAHSSKLYQANPGDRGSGIIRENVVGTCDGLYTDSKNIPLVTYHADCVPLFFYDSNHRAVAICHAGWRGVASHITSNAIESLSALGSKREDILAAVGPCISVNHFEVQADVHGIFKNEFGEDTIELREGKKYVDLPKACVLDMLDSRLKPDNITVSDICTFEHWKLFFSHRRDKGMTGAMAALIELTG